MKDLQKSLNMKLHSEGKITLNGIDHIQELLKKVGRRRSYDDESTS